MLSMGQLLIKIIGDGERIVIETLWKVLDFNTVEFTYGIPYAIDFETPRRRIDICRWKTLNG
jgi:hypothetical protein